MNVQENESSKENRLRGMGKRMADNLLSVEAYAAAVPWES